MTLLDILRSALGVRRPESSVAAVDARSISDHLRPPYDTPASNMRPLTRGASDDLQRGFALLPDELQALLRQRNPSIDVYNRSLPGASTAESAIFRALMGPQDSYYGGGAIGYAPQPAYGDRVMAHELTHAAYDQWPQGHSLLDVLRGLVRNVLPASIAPVPDEEYVADHLAGTWSYGLPSRPASVMDKADRFLEYAAQSTGRSVSPDRWKNLTGKR